MSRIIELCEQITGHLTSIGSPIASLLRPGLSNEQIREIEAVLPFRLPDSVVELYQWRNGTVRDARTEFFPWFYFHDMRTSLSYYEGFKDCFKPPKDSESTTTEFQSDGSETASAEQDYYIWDYRWFPVFSEVDAGTFGIVCGERQTPDGEIMHYAHTIGTQRAYLSLEAMLNTILACYEQGAAFMGTNGDLDCDDKAVIQISLQLNPGVKLWEDELRS